MEDKQVEQTALYNQVTHANWLQIEKHQFALVRDD